MNRIIILIILLINITSCNSQKNKKLSNFENLNEIQISIDNQTTNENTYKMLDSLKNVVDGADAELYIEIYKNAIIYDTKELLNFLNTSNKKIDENVIDFFEQNEIVSNKISSKLKNNIYFNKAGIIFDSDGYTNLRKDKNKNSAIIQKINTGEEVEILNDAEDWYKVKSNEGNVGYVHNSRIKFKEKYYTAFSLSAQWSEDENCGNPIGITIKNDELVMAVAPNQFYIHLIEIKENNEENIIRYKLNRLEGIGAKDVYSESYINDKEVAIVRILDNNTIEFNWLGFYNKVNNERQYSELLISNVNPVILKKCE